jgi:hypothetical protein
MDSESAVVKIKTEAYGGLVFLEVHHHHIVKQHLMGQNNASGQSLSRNVG